MIQFDQDEIDKISDALKAAYLRTRNKELKEQLSEAISTIEFVVRDNEPLNLPPTLVK